jgi:hypothetical protein
MGSISSSRWNNNSNNLKKVVAIAVMIFILFVISEVANAVQRRKTTLALHVTIDHDDELSATADSYDVVSNASLFSSLDAELEWDRYMIPDYDYHQNRVNNNNNNNNIDEGKGSTNPSSSASKRDTERKLSSHHLRRKQK